MVLPFGLPPAGVRVPRWLIVVAGFVLALLGAGYAIGQREQIRAAHDLMVDYRLCRIEHALSIEPWQACPFVPPLKPSGEGHQ